MHRPGNPAATVQVQNFLGQDISPGKKWREFPQFGFPGIKKPPQQRVIPGEYLFQHTIHSFNFLIKGQGLAGGAQHT